MTLRTTPPGLQKERWRGEVVKLFPSWHTGIIRGDDGREVFFGKDSFVLGFGYADASLGLRVSYEVYFVAGTKVPTAINLEPIHGNENPVLSFPLARDDRIPELLGGHNQETGHSEDQGAKVE